MATLAISLVGYLGIVSKNKSKIVSNLHQAMKTSILFIATGYTLSPVLYTPVSYTHLTLPTICSV